MVKCSAPSCLVQKAADCQPAVFTERKPLYYSQKYSPRCCVFFAFLLLLMRGWCIHSAWTDEALNTRFSSRHHTTHTHHLLIMLRVLCLGPWQPRTALIYMELHGQSVRCKVNGTSGWHISTICLDQNILLCSLRSRAIAYRYTFWSTATWILNGQNWY